jgi:hypothetical protein
VYAVSKVGLTAMPWTRGSLLGEGGYGRVFECLDDDGRICAAKVVALRPGDDERARVAQAEIEREVEMMKRLSHPNIVRYIGTERDAKELIIFLELVPGGSISSMLGKYGKFKESGKPPTLSLQRVARPNQAVLRAVTCLPAVATSCARILPGDSAGAGLPALKQDPASRHQRPKHPRRLCWRVQAFRLRLLERAVWRDRVDHDAQGHTAVHGA